MGRITPEVGKVYKRNNTRKGTGGLFDRARGHKVEVRGVTRKNVLGEIVSGPDLTGYTFNPLLSDFTTKYFEV